MIDTSNLVTNYITSMFIDVNIFITCVYNYNYYNLLIHFRTGLSSYLATTASSAPLSLSRFYKLFFLILVKATGIKGSIKSTTAS